MSKQKEGEQVKVWVAGVEDGVVTEKYLCEGWVVVSRKNLTLETNYNLNTSQGGTRSVRENQIDALPTRITPQLTYLYSYYESNLDKLIVDYKGRLKTYCEKFISDYSRKVEKARLALINLGEEDDETGR